MRECVLVVVAWLAVHLDPQPGDVGLHIEPIADTLNTLDALALIKHILPSEGLDHAISVGLVSDSSLEDALGDAQRVSVPCQQELLGRA